MLRKFILKVHLYLALGTGIFIFVVAITGAALVFEEEIDHTINSKMWHVTAQGTPLPLETLVARCREQFPHQRLVDIVIAQEPDLAYRFRMGDFDALINPYTGQVQGTRDFGKADLRSGFARLLHDIHTRLLAGRVGEYFVGAITVVTLIILLTGVVLWWPRKILSVLSGASWKRINFDLHNVFGIYASIFLIYVALSGIIISFEGFTDPFLRRHLNSRPEVQPQLKSTPVAGGTRIPVDAAIQIANEKLPGAVATIVNVPSSPTEAYRVTKRFPEDRAAAGRSRIYLDQFSGKVLYVKSTRTDELGTRIVNIKRAVHTGDLYGWPTRILAFLSCLFLAGQVATGTIIWWKKIQVPAAKNAKGYAA
jgi:uncharacterized iron-regulated membrane protein